MRMSEQLMRVPEVARLLAVEGTHVYRLIERGELEARKGPDGLVYVTDEALQTYRDRQAKASR
jgi:excisionase family DNA binding protein